MKLLKYIFSLSICAFVFSGCKLDPVDFNHTAGSGGSYSDYYFKGELGGTKFDWQGTTETGTWLPGSLVFTSEIDDVNKGSASAFIANKDGKPTLSVQFNTLIYPVNGNAQAATKALITTGPWAYTANVFPADDEKGVVINYTDDNENLYSSIGDQAGSTATVQSVTEVKSPNSTGNALKVKITLSCNLYPTDGSTNTITLRNTEAVLLFDDF
jgi:hypothetical protein